MANENDYLIFVVENNKIFNHLVTEYLKKQHFTRIKSVFSGEECMEAIERGEIPDIVIQDYLLEEMNGIDVLRKVKKKSPRTEFLFLTSNENMEVAVNTIKFGAYDYIVKDKLALEKVVYKLNKIIQLKKLQKKNRQIRMSMFVFLGFIFLVVIFAFLYFVVDIFNVRNYT
jgi:DNA-binding NtrC family response regulator